MPGMSPTDPPSRDAISRALDDFFPKFVLPPSVREGIHVIQTNFSMEDALRKVLVSNPFIPPTDGCPINELPNELLSHIFWLGTMGDEDEDEDEEDEEDAYALG